MTREKKYYTPTIDEFYVGFEFEVNKVLQLIPDQIEEWKQTVFNQTDIISDTFVKNTRVKYLDREDIEGLGFKLMNSSSTIGYHLVKDNDRIWLDTENIKGKCVIAKGLEIVFKGIIKNKSKLKKLMKMLNI